ncbi:RPM1 interacting protein 13-like [Cornus florida]|uniref:RPM1 interacting protein 13-like n=1 Tax=Cornus florida TaxID=4283 RepID=UPI00289CBF18|nr:RPM1 interacting protein 13-like [Cornus florida]
MEDKHSEVIDICSPPSEVEGTPLRPIFCLKRKTDMKEFEEKEDCFILDFDPDDAIDIPKLAVTRDFDDSDSPDLSVVAEKGQIACRDYPHSRHVCVKFPFEKTPHESYCELCYCYVCDLAAPCKCWLGPRGHCHAIDNEGWKLHRRLKKQLLNQ